MKKVFLFMVCAASLGTASAQNLKYGIKAGANFANITGDVQGAKTKVDFNAGAFVKFHLTEAISLQPELYYSGQGAKSDNPGEKGKINLGYLNLPVLFQYNVKGGFFAETGPQIGFLLSAKAKPDGGGSVDIKDAFKKTDFDWAFGVGYLTPMNLGINARYNLGLGNIVDGSGDGKAHNSVIQVGVFYAFGGK